MKWQGVPDGHFEEFWAVWGTKWGQVASHLAPGGHDFRVFEGIGFEADVRPTEIPWEILKDVRAQDLIEFGFESEFVGRLPVVVVFDELSKEDLAEILRNPNNPIIISKRMDFRAYGIDLKFEENRIVNDY